MRLIDRRRRRPRDSNGEKFIQQGRLLLLPLRSKHDRELYKDTYREQEREYETILHAAIIRRSESTESCAQMGIKLWTTRNG